jgi:hypothetical protein
VQPKNRISLYSLENAAEAKPNKSNSEFFFQVIQSRTTGEQSVIVSMPAYNVEDPSGSDCPSCVAVLSSEMQSVHSGMPFGFGFLIVDQQGQILFQSGSDQREHLNLFEQISDALPLQLAVSEGEGVVNANYQGGEHRFFVESIPVNGPGWRVVTFYDKDQYELFFVESSNVTVYYWAIWLAAILFFTGAYLLIDRLLGRNRVVGILNKIELRHLFAIGVLALLTAFDSDFRLLTCLLLICILLLAIRQLTQSLQGDSVASTRIKSGSLVVLMLSLVLTVAVIPILSFHRATWSQTFTFLINANVEQQKYERDVNSKRIEAWKTRNKPHYVNLITTKYWKNHELFPTVEFTDDTPTQNLLKESIANFMRNLPTYSDEVAPIRRASHQGTRTQSELDKRREVFFKTYYPIWTYVFFVFVAGSLFTLFIWSWSNKLLGLHIRNLVKGATFNETDPEKHKYHLIYGMAERSKGIFEELVGSENLFVIDFRKVSVRSTVAGLLQGGAEHHDTVVIDHFDELIKDPELVKLRVALLEHLLYETNVSIYIISSMDVLGYLNQDRTEEPELEGTIARLAVALSAFSRHFYDEQSPDEAPDNASIAIRKLFDECFHPNLQDIREQVRQDPDFDNYEEQQVINLVLGRATPTYQVMWDVCSNVEKFTLIQLACGRPVNHNNWSVAQRLKQRGYLRRDPSYRIFNESFQWFIQTLAPTEDMDAWRSEVVSTWDRIKVPVLVLVVCGFGFIAVTQPGLLNSLFAWVLAAGAAMPVALRFAGSWWASRGGADSGSK